jgi:N-acetylneuraminic acid mutarotase
MKKIILAFFFFTSSFFSFCQTVDSIISWSLVQAFPGGGRYGMYSFSIGGTAYAGLGLDQASNAPADWYAYDSTTGTWAQKNNFPGAGRWTGSTFVLNGMGYVVCGSSFGSPALLSELWQYNPGTDAWTQKATMPGAPRQNCIGFAVNNYGYVGTGFKGDSVVIDMWKYDPDSDSWVESADFPGAARNGGTAFVLDSFAYAGVGGGFDGNIFYSDFYRYNPYSDTWTGIAPFPGAQINAASAVNFGGYAYIVCGAHSPLSSLNYTTRAIYQYRPPTNAWTEILDSFPGLGTGYGVGFVMGNSIYYGSGSYDGSIANTTDSFWRSSALPVAIPTGIANVKSNTSPDFYPNPFTKDVYMTPSPPGIAFSIKVRDLSGRVVASGLHILDNGRINYDLSYLDAGIYIIESRNTKTNQVSNFKMVKE